MVANREKLKNEIIGNFFLRFLVAYYIASKEKLYDLEITSIFEREI